MSGDVKMITKPPAADCSLAVKELIEDLEGRIRALTQEAQHCDAKVQELHRVIEKLKAAVR